MNINYRLEKKVEDVIDKNPQDVTFELIGKIGSYLFNDIKDMKEWAEHSPNATVNLSVSYDSEGAKVHEPSEEQRQQLSALSHIHKRIMDKMKESTDGMEAVNCAILINYVTAMMDEIENEKDTQE